MERDLHINEKLEKQKIAELLAQRGTIPPDDTQKQNEFLGSLIGELVMNTRFIAPVTISGEGDARNVSFHMVKSPKGENYFPTFTSSEDMEKWAEAKNADTVQLTFDNYAIMLANNSGISGLVVNPFTDNFAVDKHMVAQWFEHKQMIVQGHANHAITKDSEYELYAPSPYPFELSDKLCEVAKEQPEVERIWLRGIKLDGREGYLAVVDHTGDKSKLFPVLGEAVRSLLNGNIIHFVDHDPAFGEEAVKDVLPIYAK